MARSRVADLKLRVAGFGAFQPVPKISKENSDRTLDTGHLLIGQENAVDTSAAYYIQPVYIFKA